MRAVLKNVRLAFPVIWEPEQFGGTGEPAFSAVLLIDPETKEGKDNLALLKAAMEQVATEKWKDKAESVAKALSAKGDLCLHDGAEKPEYDGFEGMQFVSSRSKTRPKVLDRSKNPLVPADGKPYAGCYVNVSLDIWAQDNKFGKRINASLLALQFVKDGEAFSGGASYDEADFELLDDGASGGDDDGLF